MSARKTDTKTRKSENPHKDMSSDRKRCAKVERGPTKRELRKELQAEAEAKKTRRKSKKGEKVPENKTPENNRAVVESKNSPVERKRVYNHSEKSRKLKAAKILYTAENINSFLLEAKNSKSKSKATNMLLFMFRTFKNNSADLLAKIKILTSDRRVNTDGDSLHVSVMKHLFAFYDMKGSFYENLFGLIMGGGPLPKYACSYLYSHPFESEEYNEHFDRICLELAITLEKTAQLSFEDYMECISSIDAMDDVQNFRSDEESKSIIGEDHARDDCLEEAQKLLDPHSEEDASTLQSLNDEDEIERLDREIGSFFSRGTIGAKDEEYATALARYLELLIKYNYAVRVDDLIKILYFHQFEQISDILKHIVKEYMTKFREPMRVFKIFLMTGMVTPNVYSLYRIFLSHCGSDFDHLKLMRCVINFGHEDFLLDRIDKDSFYCIYNNSLGAEFDAFMESLIRLDHREDKLKELSEHSFKPEIKDVIRASLEALNKRKARKKSMSSNAQSRTATEKNK